jgi:uncharacterized damage-inducible protein DinB
MTGIIAAELIRAERRRLQQILKDFTPEHEHFRPAEGMMTVAQQINHVAHSVDWFREGGFGAGFDLDFEKFAAINDAAISLNEARAKLDRAYETFIALLTGKSSEELMEPLPPNEIMGQAPRASVVHGCNEHTAHHRGVLSVYLRLVGVTPAMVYAEG